MGCKLMSIRKIMRAVIVVLSVAFCLAGVAITIYAVHVRASATALIESARAIRSKADAQHEITVWRSRSGRQFWQESDHPGGDHNYDGQIDNLLVARLGLLKPTSITLSVTMRAGELRCVTLIMSTGRYPSDGASVWIQEWFDSGISDRSQITARAKAWGAAVEFPASTPEAQRGKAFLLNTNCFIRPTGCTTAQDILPVFSQLNSPLSSNARQPQTYR